MISQTTIGEIYMKPNRLLVIILIFVMALALLSTQQVTYSIQKDEIEMSKSYLTSYTSHDPIWIQNNQEFIDQAALEGWAGDGSADAPFIITGYYFSQETQPLRIWDTDVYWNFIDNIIDGIGDDIQCGTWIESVSNGAILDCEFLNRHSGIIIMFCENFNITGNYIHDASLNGIEFMGMMTNCDVTDNIIEDCHTHGILTKGMTNGIISGNTISNCGGRGISAESGFTNSECNMNTITDVGSFGIHVALAANSEISFNTISVASDVGLDVYGVDTCSLRNNSISDITGVGVSVDYCEFSAISMNDIQNCSDIGIESMGGANSTLYYNTITECIDYAVSLNDETEFFEIMYNVFFDNGIDCQLYDDGEANYFGYNYFSDWQSPDADADSYVDLPYEIEGAAENTDDWPITIIGYYPTATTTTTTTTTTSNPDSTMQLIIVGGAVGAIILVAGILVLKRR